MKKSLKVLIIFVMVVICFANFSYAEEDVCKVELDSNSTSLEPGDSVSLKISLSSIKASSGIAAIGGYLEFDSSIFEIQYIENEEISKQLKEVAGTDNFEIIYIGDVQSTSSTPWFLIAVGGETNGKVAILGSSLSNAVVSEETIAEISLKVKSSASSKSTSIKLSGIETYDAGQTRHSLSSTASINYKIEGASSGDDDGDDYQEIPRTTTKTNTSTRNTNTAKEDTPYTGVEDWIFPIVLTTAIGAFALVKFIKYKDV